MDTCIEPYHELVLEATLARVEEVFEVAHESTEDELNKFVLHLRSHLLVEIILLNDQIEVIVEGISYSVLDRHA